MKTKEEEIRKAAKFLLADKKVDLVIGFEEGTLPLRTSPAFIHGEAEVEKLVWNPFCENNLANFLKKVDGRKVGIVAKGCDSRSIVALILEHQVDRENLSIIGVPCEGMLDRRRVEKEFGEEVLSAEVKGDKIVVKGATKERTLDVEKYLYGCCRTCSQPNPVIYDLLVGEESEPRSQLEQYEEITDFEKKSSEERWSYFLREASKCIRCYACRESCPMCYCQECFLDSSHPKWIEKGLETTNLQIWNLVRAFHLAGRCVACGACERACPMGIDLFFLLGKVNKDVKDLFDFEAGLDPEKPPALATYDLSDQEEFMR